MTSVVAKADGRPKPSNPRRNWPKNSARRHGRRPLRSSVDAAEFLERRIVVARQLGERRLAVFRHAEVEEVVSVLRPARHAPRVGIDGADHDLVAMLDEERLQLGREQIDRPGHDQPVADEAPREGRSRQQREHDEHGGQPERHSHVTYISLRSALDWLSPSRGVGQRPT